MRDSDDSEAGVPGGDRGEALDPPEGEPRHAEEARQVCLGIRMGGEGCGGTRRGVSSSPAHSAAFRATALFPGPPAAASAEARPGSTDRHMKRPPKALIASERA